MNAALQSSGINANLRPSTALYPSSSTIEIPTDKTLARLEGTAILALVDLDSIRH